MTTTRQRTVSRGIVGRRRIVCLQTVDIGRLTSDPVYLTPGGFIAVTGEGPVDSNESSKTTLEAALSLIHGDPGWRQDSPQFSGYAASLLFNPPNAPTGARVRAEMGFIVAVFMGLPAEPSREPTNGDGPLTVWVRIRRYDDPAFEVATAPGFRLAFGDTQAERLADAKRVWSTLRGPKWGPQRYARELYGPGVSCLSYVSKRGGRNEQRTTLLGSDVSQLTPEQIAAQLIDLAGMRQLLDNEATQRIDFFRLTRQLKAKEKEVGTAATSVANFTREVESIDGRLQLLDEAERARDRYVATTVRQTLGDLADLRRSRAEAADAVERASLRVAEITDRLARLDRTIVDRELARTADEVSAARLARQPVAHRYEQLAIDLKFIERDLAKAQGLAASWSGRRADAVAVDLARARDEADHATAEQRLAAERQRAAEQHLDAVRRGTAGPAGDRLTTAGIEWQLLSDGVELATEARALFEPLLEPFFGAICVAPKDESDAVTALADFPGAQLVSGSAPMPAGVLAAPPGAAGLLSWIATDGQLIDGAASLRGLVTVVGGFAQPTIGRHARVTAASAAWQTAIDARREADDRAAEAREQANAFAAELAAAEAEQQRVELDDRRDSARRHIASITRELAPLNEAVERADSAHRDAQAARRGLEERRTEVADHLKTCRTELDRMNAHYADVLRGHLILVCGGLSGLVTAIELINYELSACVPQ
ncbi:hypothetical protein ALI22I_20005 [Saccharothrix sp. ALI-22-I]|uniref:hypothetical protein n=1 Tax=Saccharothrix sp. ALI-22-I TaxID=1933778 RepID=UPI00097BCBED|nr:hypothetical protein [Saccharothrix sp. ALI-22-I]ONI88031.1 hypothetical protein ALI22I_20005 [Saccharothrix sp. ALI-22-I]